MNKGELLTTPRLRIPEVRRGESRRVARGGTMQAPLLLQLFAGAAAWRPLVIPRHSSFSATTPLSHQPRVQPQVQTAVWPRSRYLTRQVDTRMATEQVQPSRGTALSPAERSALVVGGGVSGLSVALELRSRGWEVTLLSRLGSESATLAAGGMLAPQAERLPPGPLLDLCLRAREEFAPWLRSVEVRAGGVNTGPVARGGFVSPAFDGDAVARWRPPMHAGPATWLGGDEMRHLEPALSEDICGGWWYPSEASVDPRLLMPALTAACKAEGVNIVEGCEVVGLQAETGGESVRAVRLADGTERPVSQLVLCAGSWLRKLLPVPCVPIKGQMLSLSPPTEDHSPALMRTVFAERCYLIPRQDGRIVVGATEEPAEGFSTRSTAGGVHALLSAAISTMPSLGTYTLDEVWAGLRPTTPDLMPLLGPSGHWRNVHVAGGYHRNGILLSPICARLVADGVEGTLRESDEVLLRQFACDRFYAAQGGAASTQRAPTAAYTSSDMHSSTAHEGAPAEPARTSAVQPDGYHGGISTAPVSSPGFDETVSASMRANRNFIDRLQAGDVAERDFRDDTFEETSPDADPAQSAQHQPNSQYTESVSEMGIETAPLPSADDLDKDEILLWRIESDGTRTPIKFGQPPPELMAGYGDTVLPPPVPEGAGTAASSASQSARARDEAPTDGPASKPQKFWDPTADIGESIGNAYKANRRFIEQNQASASKGGMRIADSRETVNGTSSSEFYATSSSGAVAAAAAAPYTSTSSVPDVSLTSSEKSALDDIDKDEILLWRIESDGTRTPIRFGHSPPELMAGYGDTVLPPPVPEDEPVVASETAPRSGADSEGVTPAHEPYLRHDLVPRGAPAGEDSSPRSNGAHDGVEPGSPDALHSMDAYDSISTKAGFSGDRGESIRGCHKANYELQKALEQGDDSALLAAIEADLAAFREQENVAESKGNF